MSGLAEQCVQTVKRSLRRHCEDTETADAWDLALPYVSLGYNCSKQMSTNCSPFQLLYAREPQFPSAAAQLLSKAIVFNDPKNEQEAADELLRRAGYLSRCVPTIANNLAIAQHRDKLRYAQTRSGSYLPLVRKFMPGDYVYLRRPNSASTLQVPAQQTIARILEIKDTGVATLQGKCGQTRGVHVSNMAPCHLPYMDGSIDPELAMPPIDHACEVCAFPDDDWCMLLCDWCGAGYHTYCLEPKLEAVPKGDWLCPVCLTAGITFKQLQDDQPQRASKRAAAAATDRSDSIFADPATRMRDKNAAALDGRLVSRHKSTKKGTVVNSWGTIRFRGAEERPHYFHIKYDDGSEETLTNRGLRFRQLMPAGSIRPSLIAASAQHHPSCQTCTHHT